MTLEEKIILVRLSNRLSWWFCCVGKDQPELKISEKMTLAQLDKVLEKAYNEYREKEAASEKDDEKKIKLTPRSSLSAPQTNYQDTKKTAENASKQAQNNNPEGFVDSLFDLFAIMKKES